MNWKASPPGIEIAATAVAALSLGGASGFAVTRIGPFGAGLVEAIVTGLFAALAGGLLIGRVDRRRGSPSIASLAPLASDVPDEEVLLLDQFVEDEALLLDDPLPMLRDDSRVVRLFAAYPADADAAPSLTGPGEMIARIENFLGQPRGGTATADPPRGDGRAAAEDASAALHAALADIRRSLRQA